MNDERLIPTERLALGDVPGPGAGRDQLEQFCLTIDGYEGERFSIDDLMTTAERVEAAGWENATLDELRVTAFIRQRQLRWNTVGDDDIERPMLDRIRKIVDEIRDRLKSDQH